MHQLKRWNSKLQQRSDWQLITITTVLLISGMILRNYNPATVAIYPPSPFRVITGFYCPGCGTLRSLHQLLHGHWLKALDLNPLMIIALPFLTYSYIVFSVRVLLHQVLPFPFIKSRWIWGMLKLILVYWILRNLPFAPFAWLAP